MIRTATRQFDDFASSGADSALNDRILGLTDE
jgi:hypothetical protein